MKIIQHIKEIWWNIDFVEKFIISILAFVIGVFIIHSCDRLLCLTVKEWKISHKEYKAPRTELKDAQIGDQVSLIPVYHGEEFLIIYEGLDFMGYTRQYSESISERKYYEMEIMEK